MSEYCKDPSMTKALQTRLPGVDIHAYSVIDSTNTEAKRMCANGHTGNALIVAGAQTAGRGRMGRAFYSPASVGAYFSILYTPREPLENAVRVTSAAAVALMRAIRTVCGIQTKIKWVNDLYLGERKVAGILCESVVGKAGAQIIIGIGVNLNTSDFPAELQNIAGSLGSTVSPDALIAETYKALLPYLLSSSDPSWLADYRTHSCVLGRSIRWIKEGVTYEGVADSIDDTGALLAFDGEGNTHRLHTGEITLRLQ